MLMRINMACALMQSKSNPALTASAWREDSAGNRCNLMGVGMIVPVEFIVDHIIDPGCWYFLSWLEFIDLFLFCHVGLLLLLTRRAARHARESGHPGAAGWCQLQRWIPAFAGMTAIRPVDYHAGDLPRPDTPY